MLYTTEHNEIMLKLVKLLRLNTQHNKNQYHNTKQNGIMLEEQKYET